MRLRRGLIGWVCTLIAGCGVAVTAPIELAWRPDFEAGLAALDADLDALEAQLNEGERRVDDLAWVAEHVVLLGERDRLVRERWSALMGGVPPLQRVGAEARLDRRLLDVDVDNAARLSPLLDRHGWTNISDFGAEADRAAWRVVQHADGQPELQARALLVLEGLAEVGETDPAHYAYLADRVAVGRGEPQPFGTQGRCAGQGQWVPHAVRDPEGVDSRRAAMGLPPMAEYTALAAELCP